MPDFEDKIPISEFSYTNTLHNTDQAPIIQQDGADWDNFRTSMADIGLHINKDMEYVTDLHTTSKKIIGAINELADGGGGSADIISEASGAIATFNDGGDNIPVKSLVTEITAQQAGTGTPSPDNVRAITGFDAVDIAVCGKNFNQITETSGSHNGITYTFNDDGTISASGSVPSGNSYKNVGHFILQAGTYTISGLPLSLVAEARKCAMVLCKDAYSGSVNIIKTIYSNVALSDQFTLTEATDCYLRIYVYSAAGAISDVIFSPQIELSNEATAYETHKGTTHTIPLGQTIYGGEAELVSGSGVKKYGYILLNGSESWSEYPQQNGFSVNLTDSVADSTDLKCNLFPIVATVANFGLRLTQSQLRFCHITDNISGVTDLATWKTWLSNNNVQVVYPLLNDTVFAFGESDIPTLSGLNNVYANSGDINALTYFNDKADDIASMVRLMTRS